MPTKKKPAAKKRPTKRQQQRSRLGILARRQYRHFFWLGLVVVILGFLQLRSSLAPGFSYLELSPDQKVRYLHNAIQQDPPPKPRERMYDLISGGNEESAKQLLDNCWPIARNEPACFDGLPKWDEDPYDEQYWRFIFYSLRPLSHLLTTYRLTGEDVYRDKLVDLLDSYLDRAESIEFDDSHAIAFRVMVLTNLYHQLMPSQGMTEEMGARVVADVERLAAFLADPEEFDAHYNHGFTQASALLLAAVNFPDMNRAEEWRQLGVDRLTQVMEQSVDVDGVEIEQSTFYHFYVMNFAWEIFEWAHANDVELSDAFNQKLARMVDYAVYVIQPDGRIPALGSTPRPTSLGDRDILERIAGYVPELRYVLSSGEDGRSPRPRNRFFPSSGQYFLRSGFGDEDDFGEQAHVTFKSGPFRTDHSHRDALSVVLYARGRQLLPDSGLYSYEDGPLHDYFFGTAAHNTVMMDGRNQVRGGGDVITTLARPNWSYQSAKHNLYANTTHRRGVLLLGNDVLVIVDELDGRPDSTYEQLWHLPPGLRAETDGTDLTVTADERVVMRFKQLQEGASVRLSEGQYSPSYEEAVPATTITYEFRGAPARLVTVISLSGATIEEDSLSRDDGRLETGFRVGRQRYQVDFINFGQAGQEGVSVRQGRAR